MADNEEVQEAEVVETEAPEAYESETARYLRIRREAKEQAAVMMAAEAKAAQKAKDKRLGKAPEIEGYSEFIKAAAEVEKSINAKPKEEEKS